MKNYTDSDILLLTPEDLENIIIFEEAISSTITDEGRHHLLQNAPVEYLERHIKHLVTYDLVYTEDIPWELLKDEELAFLIVERNISDIEQLPHHYQNDPDFIMKIMNYNPMILKYASQRVLNNEGVIQEALNIDTPAVFQYIPEKFKERDVCINALSSNYDPITFPKNWKYIPDYFTENKEFIKEAGLYCPKLYEYLSQKIKEDEEITDYFIEKYRYNIKFVPEEYKNKKEKMKILLKQDPYLLSYVSDELKNDRSFVFPIIRANPSAIHLCGSKIKLDKEIAKYICDIKVRPSPIEFFDEIIKADVEMALISVIRMPESMNDISKKLRGSEAFVSSYIDQDNFNPIALHYISENLKNNASIMKKAYDKNSESVNYIGREIKKNHEFLNHIYSDENQGKSVPKGVLLENLKQTKLKEGDEEELLLFCDNSGFDINQMFDKGDILRVLDDDKLVAKLRDTKNAYEYLQSIVLSRKLKSELSEKPEAKKKLKI